MKQGVLEGQETAKTASSLSTTVTESFGGYCSKTCFEIHNLYMGLYQYSTNTIYPNLKLF